MPTLTARSPLIIDVTSDLKRVDMVMTKIISDRSTWDNFFHDPNGVLIAKGLHPPTSSEINRQINDIFYAVLSNRQLLERIAESVKKFPPPGTKENRFAQVAQAGLEKGEIRHDLGEDIDALSHLVADVDTFRAVLGMTLHDVNGRGILQKKHSKKSIDDYVDRIVAIVVTGKSMRSEPPLETWDRNYGIGKAFGGLWVEVMPFVTAVAFVEIAAAVTVGVDHDLHPVKPKLDAMTAGARRGDRKQVEALAMYGKLLAFGGELMMHVANFESSR